jgi:hypothetical protein
MVPKAMKAPPAPMQGGHGFGSFMQFLGTSDLETPKGLAASTALATSLRGHKLHVKGARAAQDGNSTADGAASASDSSAPQALPLALSAANPASAAPASADAASTPGTAALPLVGSSQNRVVLLANAASSASVGIAAQAKTANAATSANAKSFLGLIAAGSSVLSAAAASSDAALSADAAAAANTAASAATSQSGGTPAPAELNEATPTVTPPGSPQPHQAGPPATAFLVNQFGAPGATSANAPETSTPAAAPQKPGHDDSAASDAAPGTASGSTTTAAANSAAMLPGAAALNARIVAGASAINDHPNQTAAPATAALTQPADPNAGTLPPNTSTGDDKGHDNSGFGLGSGSPAGIAAPAPSSSANAASDPRAFAAALNHAGVQTDAAPSSGDGTKSQQDAGSDPTGASSSTLPLPQMGSNAPAPAPSDASLRSALIALPASEQVAINLKQALTTDSDEIQIQLKPASLGTIDVKLNVNHDGRLTAVISADRSDTLNLLKQDASQLQQSLRDAGFNADSGSLSFNLRGDAQNFAQNAPPSLPAIAGPAADFPTATAAIRAQRQHTGTLDIQV